MQIGRDKDHVVEVVGVDEAHQFRPLSVITLPAIIRL